MPPKSINHLFFQVCFISLLFLYTSKRIRLTDHSPSIIRSTQFSCCYFCIIYPVIIAILCYRIRSFVSGCTSIKYQFSIAKGSVCRNRKPGCIIFCTRRGHTIPTGYIIQTSTPIVCTTIFHKRSIHIKPICLALAPAIIHCLMGNLPSCRTRVIKSFRVIIQILIVRSSFIQTIPRAFALVLIAARTCYNMVGMFNDILQRIAIY